VTVWGAIAGGFVGAIVFAALLRVAQEAGLTRMDIPLLLGTIFTENRNRATAIGYLLHFVIGIVAALVYYAIFRAVDQAGWWFGLLLGAMHAAFVGGGLANVALPAVHPRMGTPWSDADETPLLEQPGFMLVNYGSMTAAVTFVVHLCFGAIVGAFAAGF
jgi:hypothetical protein